jgi:hypothetical protein
MFIHRLVGDVRSGCGCLVRLVELLPNDMHVWDLGHALRKVVVIGMLVRTGWKPLVGVPSSCCLPLVLCCTGRLVDAASCTMPRNNGTDLLCNLAPDQHLKRCAVVPGPLLNNAGVHVTAATRLLLFDAVEKLER